MQFTPLPVCVSVYHWAITAICEHICANSILISACEGIRVDEPPYLGIVIAALQVIQTSLLGKAIAKRLKNSPFPRRE